MIRRTVHYSGAVQGVGFRWTAVRVAGRFDVTGYVRNLDDGRVELVAEGEPAEIDAFLEAVAARMGEYISHSEIHDSIPTRAAGTFRMEL